MTSFTTKGTLPKSFPSYYLALTPKLESPFALADYRPISLIGCLYNMVAKFLASILGSALGSLISDNQTVFIKGRMLMDDVAAMNEIVDLAKKSMTECLIFKGDFEKAYDSVSWDFLFFECSGLITDAGGGFEPVYALAVYQF